MRNAWWRKKQKSNKLLSWVSFKRQLACVRAFYSSFYLSYAELWPTAIESVSRFNYNSSCLIAICACALNFLSVGIPSGCVEQRKTGLKKESPIRWNHSKLLTNSDCSNLKRPQEYVVYGLRFFLLRLLQCISEWVNCLKFLVKLENPLQCYLNVGEMKKIASLGNSLGIVIRLVSTKFCFRMLLELHFKKFSIFSGDVGALTFLLSLNS